MVCYSALKMILLIKLSMSSNSLEATDNTDYWVKPRGSGFIKFAMRSGNLLFKQIPGDGSGREVKVPLNAFLRGLTLCTLKNEYHWLPSGISHSPEGMRGILVRPCILAVVPIEVCVPLADICAARVDPEEGIFRQ